MTKARLEAEASIEEIEGWRVLFEIHAQHDAVAQQQAEAHAKLKR